MGEAVLVNEKIEAGSKLLAVLDRENFDVSSAFWLHYPEEDQWRLLIATAEAENDLHRAYTNVAIWLKQDPEISKAISLSEISLVKRSEQIVKLLGSAFRVSGNSRVHMQANAINGVFVESALAYRLAA
jgi:hypothetical protein